MSYLIKQYIHFNAELPFMRVLFIFQKNGPIKFIYRLKTNQYTKFHDPHSLVQILNPNQ
jgi:hypothetical protein